MLTSELLHVGASELVSYHVLQTSYKATGYFSINFNVCKSSEALQLQSGGVWAKCYSQTIS